MLASSMNVGGTYKAHHRDHPVRGLCRLYVRRRLAIHRYRVLKLKYINVVLHIKRVEEKKTHHHARRYP